MTAAIYSKGGTDSTETSRLIDSTMIFIRSIQHSWGEEYTRPRISEMIGVWEAFGQTSEVRKFSSWSALVKLYAKSPKTIAKAIEWMKDERKLTLDRAKRLIEEFEPEKLGSGVGDNINTAPGKSEVDHSANLVKGKHDEPKQEPETENENLEQSTEGDSEGSRKDVGIGPDAAPSDTSVSRFDRLKAALESGDRGQVELFYFELGQTGTIEEFHQCQQFESDWEEDNFELEAPVIEAEPVIQSEQDTAVAASQTQLIDVDRTGKSATFAELVDMAEEVMDFWDKMKTAEGKRFIRTEKARKTIEARLKSGFSVEDLNAAALACAVTPWAKKSGNVNVAHCYRNDENTQRYLDLSVDGLKYFGKTIEQIEVDTVFEKVANDLATGNLANMHPWDRERLEAKASEGSHGNAVEPAERKSYLRPVAEVANIGTDH